MKKRPWRVKPSPKRAASPVSSSSDGKFAIDSKTKLASSSVIKDNSVSQTYHVATSRRRRTTQTATHTYLIFWCLHMLVPVWGGSGGGYDLRPLISSDYSILPPLVSFYLSLSVIPLNIPKGTSAGGAGRSRSGLVDSLPANALCLGP